MGREPLQQTLCCYMQMAAAAAAATKARIITSGLITTHFPWLSTRCQEERTRDGILPAAVRWEFKF